MTDVVIYRSDVRTGHKEVKEMKQYLSAIIEDDPEYSQYLIQCLERYGGEHGCSFKIRSFGRAEAFLASVQGLYDLVFMDVELGDGWMNGIEAARKLRAKGSMAMLFILANRSGVPVKIRVKEGLRVVSSADIRYIEVMGHDLMYHTEDEVITAYGGLKEKEEQLAGQDFARCSASVLVNLRYVDGLYGDEVSIGSERVRIGRSRKKEFMTRLNEYLGG